MGSLVMDSEAFLIELLAGGEFQERSYVQSRHISMPSVYKVFTKQVCLFS